MRGLDMAEAGGPVAVGKEFLGQVGPVAERGAQGQLPVRAELRQTSLDPAAGVAEPQEILVEMRGHVVRPRAQRRLHPVDDVQRFAAFCALLFERHAASVRLAKTSQPNCSRTWGMSTKTQFSISISPSRRHQSQTRM